MANNLHAYKVFSSPSMLSSMWVSIGVMSVTLVCIPNSPLASRPGCGRGSTQSYHLLTTYGVMASYQWEINLLNPPIPTFLSF